MTKCFNVRQKQRRAAAAERKRALHGEPGSGKLRIKAQPVSISGKRQRKLLKKWRRDQKEALQKGLLTIHDVEMASADAGSSQEVKKPPPKFHLKKRMKLKSKQQKHEGKKKCKHTNQVNETSIDAMIE